MNDLSSFRKSYEKSTLSDSLKNKTPFIIFNEWFNDAINDDLIDGSSRRSRKQPRKTHPCRPHV